MVKRLEKQLNKYKYDGDTVKFRLGTLATMWFCIFLIIMATFTELHFKHIIIPFDIFSNWSAYFNEDGTNWAGFVKTVKYIPQIPIVFFILGVLDKKYSIITILLYMILGFAGYPIFAMGGGLSYICQYGIGYIIAFIPALFFAGTIYKRTGEFANIFKAVLTGVIIINIIGALILLIIACLHHENGFIVKSLLYSMSGFKFFYDIIFSIMALYLALYLKKVFWIILH